MQRTEISSAQSAGSEIPYVTHAIAAKFFQYLEDWYYREFSSASHLSLPGLIQSASPLVDKQNGDAQIQQLRGYYFMQVAILLLALYSEIEAETKIGVSANLRYLWTILMEHYPFANEIYAARSYETRVV